MLLSYTLPLTRPHRPTPTARLRRRCLPRERQLHMLDTQDARIAAMLAKSPSSQANRQSGRPTQPLLKGVSERVSEGVSLIKSTDTGNWKADVSKSDPELDSDAIHSLLTSVSVSGVSVSSTAVGSCLDLIGAHPVLSAGVTEAT